MSAPPGSAPAPAHLAAQTGSVTDYEAAHVSVEILTREATKLMAQRDMEIRPARLSRIIRRFLDTNGRGDVDTFRRWFLGYSDPTGNAAVRNVMRGTR